MKLDKPLYHGTSKAAAIFILSYGFNSPIHFTEDKEQAIHYARAATAYLENYVKEEGTELIADGCALFTFHSLPDKSMLVPDDYNPTAEPCQWKYLKSIKGLRHFTVEYHPLIFSDEEEHLRLRCFAIGMWRR